MIGSSKNRTEIIRENAFEHKKKKPGLNLTLGCALISLQTTGPCWIVIYPMDLSSVWTTGSWLVTGQQIELRHFTVYRDAGTNLGQPQNMNHVFLIIIVLSNYTHIYTTWTITDRKTSWEDILLGTYWQYSYWKATKREDDFLPRRFSLWITWCQQIRNAPPWKCVPLEDINNLS